MKDVEGVEDVEGFEARNINIVNILNDLNILWYTPSAMQKPVIFVDWHRTLSNTLFWHSFDAGSAKEQYLRDQITNQIFKGSPEFTKAWHRGEITSEEFVRAIAEYFNESYDLLWYRFVEDCKTASLISFSSFDHLTELRKHARVVMASDNGEAFHRFIRPSLHLDEYFDDFLISSTRGCEKSDLEIFFQPYKDDIAESRALLLDDSKRSCDDFAALGGHAIHVCDALPTEQAFFEAKRWLKYRGYAP